MRLAWHSFVSKLRSCIGCDSVSGQAQGELTTAASAAHITKDTCALTPAHVGYKYLRNTDIRAVDADGNFAGASYDQQENDVEQDDSGSEVDLNLGKVSQDFLPQWEEEFLESEYQVEVFPRLLLWVSAAVSTVSVFALIAPPGSQPEDCWGHGALDMLQVRTMYASGMLWSWFKQGIVEEPEVVIGILGLWWFLPTAVLSVGIVLYLAVKQKMPPAKHSRMYPTLVLTWVVSCWLSNFSLSFLRELARATGGGVVKPFGRCALVTHVNVSTDFSTFPATRRCKDSDPTRTVQQWPFIHSAGCESLMPDSTFSRGLELLLAFHLLRCSWRTALLGSGMTLALMLVLCVSLGAYGHNLVYFALMHCCSGCVCAYLCYTSTHEAREQFARIKHIKIAATHSRKSLYTLIPPNVLARMATHSQQTGILATEIPHCTIMFCMLTDAAGAASGRFRRRKDDEHEQDDVREFERLNAVYVDMDEEVNSSALYKYQHVGPWYIIACPYAAEPFASPHRDRLKPSYATDMAMLASRLMAIARQHSLDLQVGIHTGVAAGSVIGTLRAFYCIYGDTVNTASRLCKHAAPGEIECSESFVRCLETERELRGSKVKEVVCVSRGRVHLKGFTQSIETFVIAGIAGGGGGVEGGGEGGEASSSSYAMELAQFSTNRFNVDAFDVSKTISGGTRRRSSGSAGSSSTKVQILTQGDGASVLVEDPFKSLLQYADLSPESLALLHDEEMAARRPSTNFFEIMKSFCAATNDKENKKNVVEDQYKEQNRQILRRRLPAGIVVHLAGIILQVRLLLYPDFPYDFQVLGPHLAAAHAHVNTLVSTYLAAQCGACVGLVVLGVLRLSWLPLSIYASIIWPVKVYTLAFAPLYSISQFLVISLSFRHMLWFFVLTHAVCLVCFWRARDAISVSFVSRSLAHSLIIFLYNLETDKEKRKRWRLLRVFQTEMTRLKDILNDLLPRSVIGVDLVARSGAMLIRRRSSNRTSDWRRLKSNTSLLCAYAGVCRKRYAVVLALDLCDFTAISKTMTPMNLAHMLHHVFSDFDTTVKSLNLFKMDTVGDAYIVAAWLQQTDTPPEDGGEEGGELRGKGSIGSGSERDPCVVSMAERAQKLAHKMLWLAGRMLDTVHSYRTETGQKISARIGLSAGQVVVGALGSLQPRVHIRGSAMREAERLEGQSMPGMVNVSDRFLDILSGGECCGILSALALTCKRPPLPTNITNICVSQGGLGWHFSHPPGSLDQDQQDPLQEALNPATTRQRRERAADLLSNAQLPQASAHASSHATWHASSHASSGFTTATPAEPKPSTTGSGLGMDEYKRQVMDRISSSCSRYLDGWSIVSFHEESTERSCFRKAPQSSHTHRSHTQSTHADRATHTNGTHTYPMSTLMYESGRSFILKIASNN